MKRNLRYTEDRNRALKTTRKKVRFSVTPYTKVRDGETPSPARETRALPSLRFPHSQENFAAGAEPKNFAV